MTIQHKSPRRLLYIFAFRAQYVSEISPKSRGLFLIRCLLFKDRDDSALVPRVRAVASRRLEFTLRERDSRWVL